jgi:hypothetical protein
MKPEHCAVRPKHGVWDATIIHAYINSIRTVELDDDVLMPIGPDPAGNLYEVGVVVGTDGVVVVHAVPARPEYLG